MKAEKRRKKTKSTLLLVFVFMTGLGLLLYPSISNYWNSLHQTEAVASYMESVLTVADEARDEMLQRAAEYNERLLSHTAGERIDEAQTAQYLSLLDPLGNGMMGYLEIPSIDCLLPVFHGTSDAVLHNAVGHVEWSSLPVGGKGTHCVLSGHRGMPSAKLFSELDQLQEGDRFMLTVMQQTITYEVDEIRVVKPQEVQSLQILPGADLCTLVTCTPYGINTHRLLVRGHRTDNAPSSGKIHLVSEAIRINKPIVAAVLFGLFIALLLLGLPIDALVRRIRKKRNQPNQPTRLDPKQRGK